MKNKYSSKRHNEFILSSCCLMHNVTVFDSSILYCLFDPWSSPHYNAAFTSSPLNSLRDAVPKEILLRHYPILNTYAHAFRIKLD